MTDGPTARQRPPAEVRYHDELVQLRADDSHPAPPGWAMSMRAARAFIIGDPKRAIERKFVGDPGLIDRALVTLATSRALILVGEPGTAKSWLSELISAAVSDDSTLTIQGGAATTEDQIKYSWNYAMLLANGPTPESLVPAPLLTGMQRGAVVRFEEITRCPLEVQDCMLSVLSERVMSIPELRGEHANVFAKTGFNVIATANTRDRGVNEMSAALKRRFSFETVFPIADRATEVELVQRESARMLAESGVTVDQDPDVLEVLVTVFRELRHGHTEDGVPIETPSAVMSTAEAVSVAHAIGLRAWYLRGEASSAADIVSALAGTAVKDDDTDRGKVRAYVEQHSRRRGRAWRDFHAARLQLGSG